jgi:adenylate kinase family enzyme
VVLSPTPHSSSGDLNRAEVTEEEEEEEEEEEQQVEQDDTGTPPRLVAGLPQFS